ncbi:MAG: hypothetical protein N2749_01210 [Clostridia bacterium]|nr:hypothetical protein [Clostridia bacterium]
MEYLVFVGMIVSLIGTILYIKEVIKGEVKPNRVSFFMWSLAPLIATVAAISTGVTLSVIPVFMSGFNPLLILIVSLFKKEAYWKITKFDLSCGFFSVLALILWYITKNPIIAIIFAILSDFLAAIPTIIKAWKHPKTEASSVYAAGLFSAFTSFAAIKMWDFASLAFPTYLIIANILIILSIERKRFIKNSEI